MREELIYAIGDIHGCLHFLNPLLEEIETHAKGQDYRLVFLGDYVDRGPAVKGVIDRLLELKKQGWKYPPVFLRGNHEQASLQIMDKDYYWADLKKWMKNFGGDATLESYGIDTKNMTRPDSYYSDEFRKAAGAHYDFMNSLPLIFETATHFYCHAGVNFDNSLDQQTERDLLWIREEFYESAKRADKIIVHGHSSVEEPELLPNRIGIDTGAGKGGRLTACAIRGLETPKFLTIGCQP